MAIRNIEEQSYDDLKVEYKINYFTSCTLPFLEIKGDEYKAKHSTFKDIKFESLVHFDNTNLSTGLIFDGCDFSEPVIFNNVVCIGYDVLLNPNSESITFKDCTFNEIVRFSGKKTTLERELVFENCTFLRGLDISDIKIEIESLRITQCKIYETFDLSNLTIKQNLSLKSNEVRCHTRIFQVECGSYLTIVENNVFFDIVHVLFCLFKRGIAFNNGVFKDELKFFVVKTEVSGLFIYGSTFDKAVFIEFHHNDIKPNTGINKFHFVDVKFSNGIYISGTHDLISNYSFVDEIILDISTDFKGDINFRYLDIGIISVSGINSSSNIMFQDIYVNQIKIKALINNAGLIFSRLRPSYNPWFRNTEKTILRESAIYIDDSNFGKAQFFQVDFSSFKRVLFHNVILIDISTSIVKWFTPEQLDYGNEKNYKQILSEARKKKNEIEIRNALMSLNSELTAKKEIYRQLKFATQKQGDITQSLQFQRWEMDYYRKLVNLKEPRNWSETIILWISQTNDFGQDWIKALKFTIIFSFISYIPIGFLTSEQLNYSTFAKSWYDIFINFKIIFWDNFKIWIVLLNPTHRMTDINENIKDFSSWVYFWDFLSRIIVSYFIFQIVSAFRKFNK